jgi:hypothetical protein
LAEFTDLLNSYAIPCYADSDGQIHYNQEKPKTL